MGHYTIVTFLLVYMIAAYYGKYHIQWSMRKSLLVFLYSIIFDYLEDIGIESWP